MSSVSVIIPAYNYARFLPEAIDSALSQTLKPLEVIVVDDGSTDDTEAVLERYAGEIHIIKQRNAGVSAARNAGIRASRGELIAFLDADDMWLPTKLERQVAHLNAHPGTGLVHCGLYYCKGTQRTHPRSGRERFQGACYAEFFADRPSYPSTPTILVLRSALYGAGLFDEALHRSEDLDMWIQLAREYEFGYVDEPLVLVRLHEPHEKNLSADIRRFAHSDLRVYLKVSAADPRTGLKLKPRIAQAAFSAAYWEYTHGHPASARHYALMALSYGAGWLRSLKLLAMTLLPRLNRSPMNI